MWMNRLPTIEEVADLRTGRCHTVKIGDRGEVYVSGSYVDGDPYMVMLVMYDWTPNGPVRLAAATPSDAVERMRMLIEAGSGPPVLSERLVNLMTTDGDVASEPIGPGREAIVVGRVDGAWRVRHARSHPEPEDARVISEPFDSSAAVMAAVERIRSNG